MSKQSSHATSTDPSLLIEQSLLYIRGIAESTRDRTVRKAAVEGLLELAVSLELGIGDDAKFSLNRPDVREPIQGLHAMRHLLKDVMRKTWRVVEHGYGHVNIYVQDHWLKSAAPTFEELPDVENTLKTYLQNQAMERARAKSSGGGDIDTDTDIDIPSAQP